MAKQQQAVHTLCVLDCNPTMTIMATPPPSLSSNNNNNNCPPSSRSFLSSSSFIFLFLVVSALLPSGVSAEETCSSAKSSSSNFNCNSNGFSSLMTYKDSQRQTGWFSWETRRTFACVCSEKTLSQSLVAHNAEDFSEALGWDSEWFQEEDGTSSLWEDSSRVEWTSSSSSCCPRSPMGDGNVWEKAISWGHNNDGDGDVDDGVSFGMFETFQVL
eukprot:TRINITY_DN65152_c0_g1_i2.p1 TRINITY_DN65152_c0_g1~~TRINITY_DN65152_c0_g1_i2.p1  ORF type:complete len:215 (-),score=42.00 TRINITY_DN65152_c0_g1_i2:95-739(-)